MTLYLDSTDNTKIIIKIDNQVFSKSVESPRDQDVFGFLVQCLSSANTTINQITNIEVNSGPGTFTGTRIGVAIANALAFALKVTVNGQTSPIDPIYNAPPSITTPKKS